MTEQNTVSSLPLFAEVPDPHRVDRTPPVPVVRAPPAGSQCDRVLCYLEVHKSITDTEARDDLGVARCGARIWDLKRLGFDIDTEMIAVQNRYGETCHVARYSLRKGTG